MSNMSYCKFENTYSDLLDCYDTLAKGKNETGSIAAVARNTNERDAAYVHSLIELCKQVVNEFGQDLDDLDEE